MWARSIKQTQSDVVLIVEGGRLVPGIWVSGVFHPASQTSLDKTASTLAANAAKIKVVEDATKKFRAFFEGLL